MIIGKTPDVCYVMHLISEKNENLKIKFDDTLLWLHYTQSNDYNKSNT